MKRDGDDAWDPRDQVSLLWKPVSTGYSQHLRAAEPQKEEVHIYFTKTISTLAPIIFKYKNGLLLYIIEIII